MSGTKQGPGGISEAEKIPAFKTCSLWGAIPDTHGETEIEMNGDNVPLRNGVNPSDTWNKTQKQPAQAS